MLKARSAQHTAPERQRLGLVISASKLHLSAALVFSLLLASCANPDAEAIERGQEEVRSRLRDPGSAQFQNVRIGSLRSVEGGLIRSVCGEVNAKNGFGGYVGFRPFATVVERRQSPSEAARGSEYIAWSEGVTVIGSPDACGANADIAFHCEPDGVTADEELRMATADLAVGHTECQREMDARMAALR